MKRKEILSVICLMSIITSFTPTYLVQADDYSIQENEDNYEDGQVIDCKTCDCVNKVKTDKIRKNVLNGSITSNKLNCSKQNNIVNFAGSFDIDNIDINNIINFGFITTSIPYEEFNDEEDNTKTFENCKSVTYFKYDVSTHKLFFGSDSHTMMDIICDYQKADYGCCGYTIKDNGINITVSGANLSNKIAIITPYIETAEGVFYGYSVHSSETGDCYDKDVNVLTSEWEEEKTPTCTEWGYLIKKCPTCHEIMQKKMIAPLGHTYGDWIIDKQPTCTEKGQEYRECTKCGEKEYNVLQALGHEVGDWEVVKVPTCTENGLKVKKCIRCGEIIEKEGIAPVGHNYKSTTVLPDCCNQGYDLYTCATCRNQYKDNFTKALGHSYGTWITSKPATCITEGEEYKICDRCGKKEIRTTSPLGHESSDWIIDREPTCIKEGHKFKKCNRCGAILEEQTIPKINHDYTKQTIAPDCCNQGYNLYTCDMCGKQYKADFTESLGHSYGGWIIDKTPSYKANGHKYRLCVRCGKKEEQNILKLKKIVINKNSDWDEISQDIDKVSAIANSKPVVVIKSNSNIPCDIIESIKKKNIDIIVKDKDDAKIDYVVDTSELSAKEIKNKIEFKINKKDKVIVEDLKKDKIYNIEYHLDKNNSISPYINLGQKYAGYWVEYFTAGSKGKMTMTGVTQVSANGKVKINVSNKNPSIRLIISDHYTNAVKKNKTESKGIKKILHKISVFFAKIFQVNTVI